MLRRGHPARPWLLGAAAATPLLAVLQGAVLLLEYRLRHGDAPRPETPSRGIAIVRDAAAATPGGAAARGRGLVDAILRRRTTTAMNSDAAPLRVLVLGDSLAAGVGMSRSSTPALPESIARGLSQAMGGRAVYWTCVGAPGATSLEVVRQVLDLDDLRAPLVARLQEWRMESQRRTASAARAAREWWEIHKEPVPVEDTVSSQPLARWWNRFRRGFQRDVQNLRKILEPPEEPPLSREERKAQRLDSMLAKLLRRQSLKPALIGQYDIAVILCGLNDLKDSFLPFLNAKRTPKLEEDDNDDNDDNESKRHGIQRTLVQIVDALRNRMNLAGKPAEVADLLRSAELLGDHVEPTRMDAPLIVFPALPIEPTILSRIVPLGWFIVPLIHAMDRNKKHLADTYPGLVLFVESPSPDVFMDAKMKRGSIWKELQEENIVLVLSDVAKNVQTRIRGLMDAHYEKLLLDQGEDDLYQVDMDEIGVLRPEDDIYSIQSASPMLASDGIHPNDLGYEVWGRFIAQRIMANWDKDQRNA